MRTWFSILAALAIGASAAHASGIDVTALDCPGDAGASRNATLDCAGGTSTTLLVGFAPAEAISDLVAIDTLMDFWIWGSGADVTTASANFWDFGSAHANGVTLNHLRPAGKCSDYADTWNRTGSGVGLGTQVASPTNVRIAASAYRPNNFAAAANQKLFGFQFTINTAGAVQGGGALGGCPMLAGLTLEYGAPQSASGAPTTTLYNYSPHQTPIHVTFNDVSVSTVRRTWAQLKSLYR